MTESERCAKHTFERASGFCDRCGHGYCEDCLLQPFPKRPPICKACAMALGGVRNGAAVRPSRSRKELKALQKEQARAEAEAAAALQASRRDRAAPTVNPMMFANADVVPPIAPGTKMPARTKRLWRTAG